MVALAYDGGVIVAADTLGSYGSLARFTNVSRLYKFGSNTVIAYSGDTADFQQLQRTLDDMACVARAQPRPRVSALGVLTRFHCGFWQDRE